MADAKGKRNLIWAAVIASIVVVVSLGAYSFNVIRSPATPDYTFDQATPRLNEPRRPWIDRGPRDRDFGQVPFVPAKSRYSITHVPMPHVPNPEATIPPEKRAQPAPETEASP